MDPTVIPPRRELVRRYKQTGPLAGIYLIRHRHSGRLLVGRSPNADGALNRARFELGQRGHRDRALLRDWQRDGAEAFELRVIDTVKPKDDPAFDAAAELEALHALWCEELRADPRQRYADPASPREA